MRTTIANAIADSNRQFTFCYSRGENPNMNPMEKRVARLKALVDLDGGPAEFCRKRSQPTADKPIDPTYVSQILNKHRAFGEKAAANMCRRAGLPDLFFDNQDMVRVLSERLKEYEDIQRDQMEWTGIKNPQNITKDNPKASERVLHVHDKIQTLREEIALYEVVAELEKEESNSGVLVLSHQSTHEPRYPKTIEDVIALMQGMTDAGQAVVLDKAREMQKAYPLTADSRKQLRS